jgi:flavin-dependent dehydrogenase
VTGYDAVIVGGRCAGSALAIPLARSGASVLMLDKEELGSDTISTHVVFPNTLVRLEELGVLERIRARHRLYPLEHLARILGREVAGTFTPIGGFDRALGPRRPVLDRALAEAAMDAGAEGRFGVRVSHLIGSGTDADPIRGVELEDGSRVESRWVIGADGRASFVARSLGLPKRDPISSDLSLLFAYWRGIPPSDYFSVDMREDLGLSCVTCEDGIQLLIAFGPPEFTRGTAETRRDRYLGAIREFPEIFDPAWLADAEMITEIRVVPETMLRGFFRPAAGPGWALIGDAGHFKHPATAQGIGDAIEQARYVADALAGADPELTGYEEWRDARAAGHYEWSFSFGSIPKPELAGPIFDGLAADDEAAQDFRDVFSRARHPREAISKERLGRWFAQYAPERG